MDHDRNALSHPSERFQANIRHRGPYDSETIAAWRVRMGTDEAKEIYRERASTVECVNAIARNRGLQRFLVRGCRKVRAVLLWYALAHNLMRGIALRGAVAGAAG